MGTKVTYTLAPTSAPHQDFFDEFPVEKFTAIKFFKFNELTYAERQAASTEYQKKVYDHALSICPVLVTKPMIADWSRGKICEPPFGRMCKQGRRKPSVW